MVRAYRAALAAGGLLMRSAVGLVGFLVVVGAIAPRPEPDARARAEPGDPARTGSTVVLTVPEGSLGGHLTVVDGSGRELATLTHWFNGGTSIEARRSDGVGLCSFLNGRGSAVLSLTGTARATHIHAQSDGRTRIVEMPRKSWQPSDNPDPEPRVGEHAPSKAEPGRIAFRPWEPWPSDCFLQDPCEPCGLPD
jgi:hypothetical protein